MEAGPSPPPSKRIDAGGLRVNLIDAGSGDPVLLLHGWPQNNRMWRELIPRLERRYRLLAPDLRGFGLTEAPGSGYDGETFARDQIALLDALEIERVRVIGHDWGGWTTMLLGLLHPERVERMVVIDAPHPWPRLRPALLTELWRTWYAAALAAPGLGPWLSRRTGFAKGILNRGTAPGTFDRAELDAYADSFRDPARARAVSGLYRYYQRAFLDAMRGRWQSKRLTVPTLVLFGARDRYVTPKLLEGYEPHADEMRVELVPGAGHFLVDEQPGLVAERALEFFDG
jgi:pimeloyl-ACP methyl ester carboxylesterase